jgi:ABC-2 type transport system ATP-binding protein
MPDTAGARAPLHVEAVSKRFDRTVALAGVSFDVRAGEIFGLLGPNGAGKTTMIRTILDLIKPDTGRIELFGRAFQREDRNRIGYLPEDRGL